MMKKIRIGTLMICLCLSFSLVHTAAAAYDETEQPAEQPSQQPAAVDPLLEQYAAELSGYTALPYYIGENAARYIDFKMLYPDCSWETIITDVNIGLDNDYYTNAAEIENPGSTDVLVNKYNYLPRDFVPDDLEKINSAYCFKTEMLTHDARVAFEKMCADAWALGYTLYVTSSYRSYDRQLELYKTYGIPDVTTARPGHSEHQTGLAVDVIHAAVASNSGLTETAVYKWYSDNAHKYGFIIRYQDQWRFQTGCAGEPWHLRYLGAELATSVKSSYLSFDEYYTRYIGVPERTDGEGADDAVGITAAANVAAGEASCSLSAFHVLDDIYFKLRDIAIILSGTAFAFDVAWNAETKQISLLVGTAYSSQPMLNYPESGRIEHMTATTPPLLVGEEMFELGALMVYGSNYYTLEALGALLGFTATEDASGLLMIQPASVDDAAAPTDAM